ncbi:hypothetical protein J6590_106101 [Homalodisca vitripennis]|nr:hypothetical protein J6590_106101 [Homalodisca vitripennis]
MIGEVISKKPSETLNLGIRGLEVTSKPPPNGHPSKQQPFLMLLDYRLITAIVAGKEILYYNSRQTSSGCKWIRTSAQTPMVNKQEMLVQAAEMLICKKPCDNVRDSHADMKNCYSPIMMERFGRGVVNELAGE